MRPANTTNCSISNLEWNGTLSGLSDGSHNITVFANDTSGNWNNSEVFSYVTISEEETQQLSYNSTDKLWYLNITIPAGTGLENLYLEANYTTDSVARDNTESNSIQYAGFYSKLVSLALTISESISRVASYVRTTTQALSLTELVTNIQNFFRTLLDGL